MKQQKIFGITVGKPEKKFVREAVPQEVKEAHRFTPTVPRVNLIPTQFTEKYEVQYLVRNFSIVAVLMVIFVGSLWGAAQWYMGGQEAKLTALTNESTTITAETNALQPFQVYETAVNAKRDLFMETTRNDINMGVLYGDVNDASAAAQVDVRSLRAIQYEPGNEGADCVDPDPFATTTSQFAVAGCLVFEGGATSLGDTLAFLDQLVAEGELDGDFYRNPYVSSFTSSQEVEEGELPNTFSATLFFTDALYSDSYVEFFNAAGAEASEGPAEPQFLTVANTLMGGGLTEDQEQVLTRLATEVCAPAFNIDTNTEIQAFVLAHPPAAANAETITPQLTTLLQQQCNGGS